MDGNPGTLRKVGECLYRNHRGTYFALIKSNGKQIKRSLKTEDAALARRRLKELRIKATGLTGDERTMRFDELAEPVASIETAGTETALLRTARTRHANGATILRRTSRPFDRAEPSRNLASNPRA